jgi:phosphate transport system substrate-binding protein
MKKVMSMVAVLACLGIAGLAQAAEIQIKGSDTLINLVQKLSEDYMNATPGSYIAVTGGGSGTGIAALINKKCDIANSSREIKASEVDTALKSGVDPKGVVVAIDGLSVIVNPQNPVTQLTMDQIGGIFRGDIKNWKEVGGSDMPITLYGRQSNSGTYAFFMEVVLKGDYSPKMNNMNGNSQIVEAVKSDASGIGYVGVGYVKKSTGISVVNVAAKAGREYKSPLDTAAVKNGTYAISRPLLQYVSGKLSPEVSDFIAFELSSEGQRIVEEEGFFAIPEEYQKANEKLLGL